jgi:hypothetical protein
MRILYHGWQFACKVATGEKVLQEETPRPNPPTVNPGSASPCAPVRYVESAFY